MVPAYPTVFFCDRWVTRDEATVPIDSLALRYGLSVFEGIRLYVPASGGPVRPFLLEHHIERMERSLQLMRIPDPGVRRLTSLIEELVSRNHITTDAYVRVAVTPLNAGLLGDQTQPELWITAVPMNRKPWLAEGRSMALAISARQRGSDFVHPSAAKNIANYAGPRLAWLEAKERGFDGCVLTNQYGRLAEAPTAALFLRRGDVLFTPAVSEDVLPSITRAWVVRTAPKLGLAVRETELTRQDAYGADEAFLCGTALEFAAVRSFDGHTCRVTESSPSLRRLIARYFAEARDTAASAERGGQTAVARR